ncbi:MAG: cation transporter [Prochloraceae cyanobacterium]|nr:cation transporter [Prochloraceae cyanobacterium]
MMKNLYKKALRLEYFTVGYNVFEAIVSLTFGSITNSIALIGFGLDSVVESLSGLILIWRLQQHDRLNKELEEKIERQATKLVAITFWVLASYVLLESGKKLLAQEISEPSAIGILVAIASLIIMPILAQQKYKTGKNINSKALIADAKETLVCSWLSVALLLGLGCNYWFGFWQADPIVGLIIVIYLLKEGWETWNESDEE